MANKKILTALDFKTLSSVPNPGTGYISFGALSDGLYLTIGTTQSRLLTSSDTIAATTAVSVTGGGTVNATTGSFSSTVTATDGLIGRIVNYNGVNAYDLALKLNYDGVNGVAYPGYFGFYVSPNGSINKSGALMQIRSYDTYTAVEANLMTLTGAGAVTFTSSVTASSFSGAGTNLTGMASSLSIGGTAATASNVVNGGGIASGSSFRYITIDSTDGMAYISLRKSGATIWDIGENNGGNLEFRPAGSATNEVTISALGVITANSFVGALSGNATTATTASVATQLTVAENLDNTLYYPTFVMPGSGSFSVMKNANLTYNPSTGEFRATKFTGAFSPDSLVIGSARPVEINTDGYGTVSIHEPNGGWANGYGFKNYDGTAAGGYGAYGSAANTLTYYYIGTAYNSPVMKIMPNGQVQSMAAQGTAPFYTASTTLVPNLNAQYLNGNASSAFLTTTGGSISGSLSVSEHISVTNLWAASTAISVTGEFDPFTDNVYSLGTLTGPKRWKQLCAATGTIQTSDQRLKTAVTPFTDSEINAAMQLSKEIGTFKFLDAIAEKGEAEARLHTGMTVQKAMEIMKANNLDPFAYGFVCKNSWDAEYDDEGNLIKEAGDILSFRPDELTLFMVRGLEERMSRLENKIN